MTFAVAFASVLERRFKLLTHLRIGCSLERGVQTVEPAPLAVPFFARAFVDVHDGDLLHGVPVGTALHTSEYSRRIYGGASGMGPKPPRRTLRLIPLPLFHFPRFRSPIKTPKRQGIPSMTDGMQHLTYAALCAKLYA